MEQFISHLTTFIPQKPVSSLAFKGYPSLRDHPLHTAELWLKGKRLDDGAEGLWRIHDKLYDFEEFIEMHPGGQDWLRLTKGTDITEAFECHHISILPEQMLIQFYVRDASTSRNSPFSFREDGFYKTLKRNVREVLPTVPKAPEIRSKLFTDLLFAGYISTAVLSAYYFSFLFAIMSGIVLSTTTIAAHNFFHQRDNFRMYYFDFSMMSHRAWRVTHALSHHIYTNTVYDFEIGFTEPWFQYLPVEKHFFWRYLSWVYSPIVYLLALPVFYLRMVIQAITDGGKSLEISAIFPFLILIPMTLLSTQSALKVILLFTVIILSASVHFTVVGVNAAHHHPDIFHDGDTPRKREDLDWGLHEIDAVADRDIINESDFLVLTNFGDHCLHHMFPTIDHGRLKYLYPVFQKVCEEFGVKLRMTTLKDLVMGQYQQLARVKPK